MERDGLGGFDRLEPPDPERLLDCVHCGFCLPSCPTYLVLGNEMDSPRGRIYLIRAVAEGRAGITSVFVRHMDLCLLCRACETACPSGVQFGALMEAARSQIQRHHRLPLSERWFRAFVLRTFTDITRLRWLIRLVWFYQVSGLQRLVRTSGVLRLSPRLREMEALLPSHRLESPRRLPRVVPAQGDRRGRVGLLLGCVQRFFLPQVHVATARVLSQNGYEVVIPRRQVCCGSLLVHEGMRERGKALARRTIVTFERARVDYVVVNAAGCGSVMKAYGELLDSDPTYALRAETFARKVRDVAELLASSGLLAPPHPLNMTVTYHDACHLVHGQRIREEPRRLIRAVPGVRLVEMRESDFCCGSAGVYNLFHPEVAHQFLRRKVQHILETGADVVISNNPGCTFQIERGLRERGSSMRVMHLVELLDAAYRGGEL